MTRLTLENEDGKFTVEIQDQELTLPMLLRDLVTPVLLAAGYHPNNIKERVIGENL